MRENFSLGKFLHDHGFDQMEPLTTRCIRNLWYQDLKGEILSVSEIRITTLSGAVIENGLFEDAFKKASGGEAYNWGPGRLCVERLFGKEMEQQKKIDDAYTQREEKWPLDKPLSEFWLNLRSQSFDEKIKESHYHERILATLQHFLIDANVVAIVWEALGLKELPLGLSYYIFSDPMRQALDQVAYNRSKGNYTAKQILSVCLDNKELGFFLGAAAQLLVKWGVLSSCFVPGDKIDLRILNPEVGRQILKIVSSENNLRAATPIGRWYELEYESEIEHLKKIHPLSEESKPKEFLDQKKAIEGSFKCRQKTGYHKHKTYKVFLTLETSTQELLALFAQLLGDIEPWRIYIIVAGVELKKSRLEEEESICFEHSVFAGFTVHIREKQQQREREQKPSESLLLSSSFQPNMWGSSHAKLELRVCQALLKFMQEQKKQFLSYAVVEEHASSASGAIPIRVLKVLSEGREALQKLLKDLKTNPAWDKEKGDFFKLLNDPAFIELQDYPDLARKFIQILERDGVVPWDVIPQLQKLEALLIEKLETRSPQLQNSGLAPPSFPTCSVS